MKPADLARLFATEGPRLLRRLRRFRGRIAAEDVVQAAFTKMLEVDAAEIDEPRAYLARITRNLAIDELRKQERGGLSFADEGELDRLGVGGALTPEEMIIEGERFAFMMGVVLNLPDKERAALLMAKMGGLSHEEIAMRLGCSRHSVPRYLARALATCAEALAMFERSGLTETKVQDPD